jgi:hypothetical protein
MQRAKRVRTWKVSRQDDGLGALYVVGFDYAGREVVEVVFDKHDDRAEGAENAQILICADKDAKLRPLSIVINHGDGETEEVML